MRFLSSFFLCVFTLLVTTPTTSAQGYTPLSCTIGSSTLETVTYTIPKTATLREIKFRIDIPSGAPEPRDVPLPTVIWSHGGATGGSPNNLAAWRRATTEVCYVSVTIGHSWPEHPLNKEICRDLFGLTDRAGCGTDTGNIKLLSYVRPFDIAAVMDDLETNYADTVDASKFVIGGHSGGAGGTMMVAGATRAFRIGDLDQDYIAILDLSDPRPIAFIALSPQGPGVDGFYEGWKQGGETSWDNVTRPVLVGTGAGDNGCEQSPPSTTSSTIHYCTNLGPVPSNRKAVFDMLPESENGSGTKYRYYIDDWRASHTIFKLSNAPCGSGPKKVPQAQCDVMHDGLKHTVSGFLDFHVRGEPSAKSFLADAANIPGPPGLVEWDSK